MAHEITTTDGVVLNSTPAWHGLGVVVEHAPTTADALRIAGLDWTVEQWPLVAQQGTGPRLAIADKVANVRTDTTPETCLGIVGRGYAPIQNAALAEFCELLAKQGDVVRCETAGSIRGGAKVWFLLRGDSFSVRAPGKANDDLTPYILVSNGHDGGTALRCTPTSVRVVCSNTLHAVIPGWETKGRRGRAPVAASYTAHHVGDVRRKVEEARDALGLYVETLAKQSERINALVARDWNSEQVGHFLTQCYASIVKPIPTNPSNAGEERDAIKARDAVASMLTRFDNEARRFGATAWVAVNAFTGWDQHDRAVRVRDPHKAREQRIASTLFGDKGDAAIRAFALALTV